MNMLWINIVGIDREPTSCMHWNSITSISCKLSSVDPHRGLAAATRGRLNCN